MDSLRLRCVCLLRVNELIPLRASHGFVIDYFFCFCWIQRFRSIAVEWELIEFHSNRCLVRVRVQAPETLPPSPVFFSFFFDIDSHEISESVQFQFNIKVIVFPCRIEELIQSKCRFFKKNNQWTSTLFSFQLSLTTETRLVWKNYKTFEKPRRSLTSPVVASSNRHEHMWTNWDSI